MRNLAGRKICLLLLLTLIALVLSAASTGRIAGVMRDPSGAVVPGGQIRIKNLDSGVSQSTTTDQQGRYVFDAVPAGRYEASATSSGPTGTPN